MQDSMTMKFSIAVGAMLLAALLVAGCGVRGSLTTPKDEAPAPATASADSGQGKPANATPKPHKGSVLDGLIR